jgi:hypothetical protein
VQPSSERRNSFSIIAEGFLAYNKLGFRLSHWCLIPLVHLIGGVDASGNSL